jgi:hypothetical protein
VVEADGTAAALRLLRRLRGDLHLLCVDASEFTRGVTRLVEEFAVRFPAAATLALGAPLPGPGRAYQPKPFTASELADRAAALVGAGEPPA